MKPPPGREAWPAPEGEVDAILGARHGDPFALLGPHAAPGGFVLRAFVPGAEALALLTPAGAQPLGCRHPEGFFEALLPGARPAPGYRLRATRAGLDWDFADPFGFGPGLGPLDDHLLREGTHTRLQDRLGAHPVDQDGVAGTRFAVWAPQAARVSVVGSFNAWDGRRHPMRRRADSGIWEIFLPGIAPGAPYKYEIMAGDGPRGGRILPLKADPCGRAAELRPNTASLVADPAPFAWTDAAWMAARAGQDARRRPLSIYEVHPTSWRRHPDGGFWHWDELAAALIPYVADLGFTHVELMPVMEHPLDASWGYQPIGMFAPTARLGGPEGLARFIDAAHAAGIGVILDWVPAHFPQDEQGLARFDGAPLYEHPDPKRGFHAAWGTGVYDYGRPEVAAFLASNALFWLDRFHADGLRVDAVSFMIHLDHGRAPGGWAPNADGSTRNRDAIAFLRRLNALVAAEAPGALMIAEEATDFPGVTSPDGLGFGFKWNMGWMNDTLRYMAHDPLQRRWFHGLMNFGLLYAFDEAFILPLSHDEVVHGKGSLLGRMPKGAPDGGGADDWQRFANLRCYYGFMWGHPGKKLLFMGDEIGQWREWSEDRELDWWLLQYPAHQGVQALVRDLNRLHRRLPALHAGDADPRGFRWIDPDDELQSVLTWIRQDGESLVAVLCNLTPVPRAAYRIGLPRAGRWREVLNTDSAVYGGSNLGNLGVVEAAAVPAFGLPASASLLLPPLATVYLVPDDAVGGARDAEQP